MYRFRMVVSCLIRGRHAQVNRPLRFCSELPSAGGHSASGPDRPIPSSLPASSGSVGQLDMKSANIMMIFTCDVCNTRTAKLMSRRAYEHGVVIAQCPSCKNRHLIADNLNWFGEGRQTIEDILQKKGASVKKSWDSEDFQVSPEDLELGKEALENEKT